MYRWPRTGRWRLLARLPQCRARRCRPTSCREGQVDFDPRRSQTYDLIFVEICLLDGSPLDRDLAIKCSREVIDHSALDLCLDDAGINNMPAIDGGNDTDTYFAFLIDRHLGDLADNRVVAFVTAIPRPRPAGSGLPQSPFSASLSSTPRKSGRCASRARRNLYGSCPAACANSST